MGRFCLGPRPDITHTDAELISWSGCAKTARGVAGRWLFATWLLSAIVLGLEADAKAVSLRIDIVDAQTGRPIPAAVLHPEDHPMQIPTDGRWKGSRLVDGENALLFIPNKPLQLEVKAPGYESQHITVTPERRGVTRVRVPLQRAGDPETPERARRAEDLEKTSALSIYVIDSKTGESVAKVVMRAENFPDRIHFDMDGHWEGDRFVKGENTLLFAHNVPLTLELTAPGYESQHITVTPRRHSVKTMVVWLEKMNIDLGDDPDETVIEFGRDKWLE